MHDAANSGVVRLPAYGCQSFFQGRCLYEEQLNPGLHLEWHCSVLTRWESVYEDFLNRAENFGLEESELNRLWRLRFERLAEEPIDCQDLAPAVAEAMPECLHLFVDLCLLRFPLCGGHCKNYCLHTKA